MAVRGELLYGVNQRILGFLALAILLGAFEIAFRVGRRYRDRADSIARSQISTLQAAILGLLALLLGFSFAMAESRFDFRRGLILDEATAIGTTCLRARLAPEPHRAALLGLLGRYVDARIEFYRMPGIAADPVRARTASRETERLQGELWAEASAAANLDPRAVTTGLLLQSLNEVIDLHEKRLVSLEAHVPEPIILLLVAAGAVAFALLGYGSGLAARRQVVAAGLAALVVASVMVLIVDLDRPERGRVRVGQETLLRLRDSLASTAPEPSLHK